MIRSILAHYGVSTSDRPGWQPVRCPFHDDEHKSASVCLYDGPRDVFVCHGCGIKGDAIGIIMQHEGMSYIAAKQRAEELAGDERNTVQSQPVAGGRLSGKPRTFTRLRGW